MPPTRPATSPRRPRSPARASPARARPVGSPLPPKTIKAVQRRQATSPSPAKKASPKPEPKPRFTSYLDRLQKDAHSSELDFNNTSPATFVFLSLIQLPVTIGLSYLAAPPGSGLINRFSTQALLNIGGHWCGFGIALAINSVKYFDITEDITLLANIVYSYKTIKPALAVEQGFLANLLGAELKTEGGRRVRQVARAAEDQARSRDFVDTCERLRARSVLLPGVCRRGGEVGMDGWMV